MLTSTQAFAAAGNAECARIAAAMGVHPRLQAAVENIALHAYERANGPLVGAPDWSAIVAWLVANAPAIVQVILMVISVF